MIKRADIAAYNTDGELQHFLMVLPDVMYLWKNFERVDDPGPPDYQMSTPMILAGYFGKVIPTLDDINEDGLELLTSYWLNDLINVPSQSEMATPDLGPIYESGLHEAIHRGSSVLSMEP